jgi:hypothetical protein
MPPNQLIFALLLVLVFTFLITLLEITNLSKSRLKSVLFNLNYLIYFLIQLAGNILTTLLATYLVKDKIPDDLNDARFFIYAFFGVFAFYGILSNSNINLFDAKLITIQEWLQIAKDSASEAAAKNDLLYEKRERMELAIKLKDCDESMVDTSLFRGKSKKEKAQFIREMDTCGGDKKLYKCLVLISEDINTAKALIINHSKELARTKPKIFELDK